MSLLFGPHTKLSSSEEEIAKKLAEGRIIYEPVFDEHNILGIFEDNKKTKGQQNEILVGLDTLKINQNKLFSKEAMNYFENKFISIPDILIIKKENNTLKISPHDIKEGGIPYQPTKRKRTGPINIFQISAYNLGYLINESEYLKEVIQKAKQDLNCEDVEIHSGKYYFTKKVATQNKSKQKMLEQKIIEELKDKNIEESLDIAPNINSPNLINIKKTKKQKSLFVTPQSYLISEINYSEFINTLSEIKNKISIKGFYPTAVLALGADSKGNLIKQLEYNPNTRIKTYTPRKEKLKLKTSKINNLISEQTDILKNIPSQIEQILRTATPELAEEVYKSSLNNIEEKIYSLEINIIDERKKRIRDSVNVAEEKLRSKKEELKTATNINEKNIKSEEYQKEYENFERKLKERKEILNELSTRKKKLKEEFNSGFFNIENLSKESEIEKKVNEHLYDMDVNKPTSNQKRRRRLHKLDILEKEYKKSNDRSKEAKEKYLALRTQIFKEYNIDKVWYTEKGFQETEKLRQQKIDYINTLKDETQKNIYKLRHKKKEIKRAIIEENQHLTKNEIKWGKKDKKNTKEILKFHKDLLYKIAKKDLDNPHPQTLFLNFNNNKVYKIEFYNKN